MSAAEMAESDHPVQVIARSTWRRPVSGISRDHNNLPAVILVYHQMMGHRLSDTDDPRATAGDRCPASAGSGGELG